MMRAYTMDANDQTVSKTESAIYGAFTHNRDMLWDMGAPLYERLTQHIDDQVIFATCIGCLNALAWYVLLPLLVLRDGAWDLLVRSCVTLLLCMCLNLAFRFPLPIGSMTFSDADSWFVYLFSPVVLPAHGTVTPRLGLSWVVLWSSVQEYLQTHRTAPCWGFILVLGTVSACVLLGTFVICTHACHGVQMMLSVFVATSTFTPVKYAFVFLRMAWGRVHAWTEEPISMPTTTTTHEIGPDEDDSPDDEEMQAVSTHDDTLQTVEFDAESVEPVDAHALP
jgi:hypothetical protein